MSIWGRLGGPFGELFGAFWKPRRAKFAPKPVLKAYPHQKREFFTGTTFSNTKTPVSDPKMASKKAQDGPKRLPRRSSRAILGLLKIVLNLDLFWVPFWTILAPKMGLHSAGGNCIERSGKWSSFCMLFWAHPSRSKRPQDPPKRLQDPPKNTPRGPKNLPRPPQEAPRPPQEAPRSPQEPSKTPQEAVRDPFKRSQEQPQRPWEVPSLPQNSQTLFFQMCSISFIFSSRYA